jgi:hydrogenase/urease accessory protein HupE
MMDGRPPALGTALFAALLLLTLCKAAAAHAIGLSRGEYHATAQGLDVTLVLARPEVSAAVPSLDPEGRGFIDETSLARARSELARGTMDKIRVTTPAGPCAATLLGASLTEQDGLEIRAHYACSASHERLTVTLPLLDELSHGHRHAAHVTSGAVVTDHLLSRQNAMFEIARASAVSAGAPGSGERAGGFVRMGIEHILTGYDHLLFLVALVLAGGTIRSLGLAVTSFTIAHSVTLALAVLGFVAPPARWIEPAIALSVVLVGAENFFARPQTRPWMTFAFGLVHGFGFAGALGEVALPRAEVPWALLSFNVGVEIGQLAWMLVLGLLVTNLRRWPWFGRRGVPVLSAFIVAIGVLGFVGRLRGPAMEVRVVAGADARCG